MDASISHFIELDQPRANPAQEADASVANPVLLRARGLHKHFGGQKVLDGVDLELRQGEIVLLRGENGAGKTTLLNILTGNLEPDAGEITYLCNGKPRTYRFPRRWWDELNPFDHFAPEFVARQGVGRTWQDVRLFHAHSLRDNIAVSVPEQPGENPIRALISPKLARDRERTVAERARTILEDLGLKERAESSADRISLGQSKRVAIGRALASRARIIFLDEPLAGLDRQGVADVLRLLTSLVQDHGVTLVIVEHVFNLAHLREIATADWLLSDGELVRSAYGGRGAVCVRESQTVTSGRSAVDRVISGRGGVEQESLPGGATLTRVMHPDVSSDPLPLLSISHLTVQRGTQTLRWVGPTGDPGLTFSVRCGEVVFLQAPNGWGKTTFMECVAGLTRPLTGHVVLDSKDLATLKPWERVKLGVRLVRADRNVFLGLSGNEVLRLAAVSSTPEMAGLPLARQVSTYSGGERQQLALHAAQRDELPRILLLDEPFSMLDSAAIEQFGALVQPDPRYAVIVALPLVA